VLNDIPAFELKRVKR